MTALRTVYLGLAQRALWVLLSLLLVQNAWSHSVGQVQTTKFFAPETVQMLIARAGSGTPGFRVGDSISYIVQFTPIANGATIGAAGYVTDYIPPGTEVIDASFVQQVGAGTYVAISPSLPGGIDNGWAGGQNTYAAPFNTPAYDSTGLCSTYARTNNCNGSVAQQYADTGIFFSTDSRTAAFPSPPSRILQSTNGFVINPTGAGQLNPILGQTVATTHNLWDAQQTNAFGTTSLPTLTPNANSSQGIISSSGRRAAPFGAGSAVAGPQSGYPLDATAGVGPWQRIAYPGSRIGTRINGPAFDRDSTYDNTALSETVAVKGEYTTLGWNLSPSNPLPSGTNAVRWAVGKLVVGQNKFVKLTLRLTAPVPIGGLINGSEVFGGDAAEADGGNDSTWRYHVPSVADNNSNLFVLKDIIGYNCTGLADSTCVSSNGFNIPPNAKVRYRITYLNAGNAPQTNVVLSDTLPSQTTSTSNFQIISGQNVLPTSPAAPSTGTFTFKTITALGAGEGGAVTFDVQLSVTAGSSVTNLAKLTSSQVPGGVVSNAVSSVVNAPNLLISKLTSTPNVAQGGTATYTITVTNIGTAAATNIVVDDFLPFSGTSADPTRRFVYASTSSITGIASVVPTVSVPPSVAPYNVNTNQQQVTWNFGGNSLLQGASFTITFNATVGTNMPASATPVTNDVRVAYTTPAGFSSATGQAPVTVVSPIQVTKAIDCIYNLAGTACDAYDGSGTVPVNGKIRYRLDYANTGTAAHTNVFLCDQLPSQITGIAAVTTPTIAPTPAGPFADNPNIGARTSPANAACGFTGGTTFSYGLGTVAAGASGVAFFDVQTSGVISLDTITNTGKIVSTQAPAGSTSVVQVTARSVPNLLITKLTTTPTIAPSGTATYTISVTNDGDAPASAIKIYDFLPFVGTTADATRRFNFVVGSSVFAGSITAVTPATVVPPNQSPFSGNVNQQQVLWDFGAQTLAAGASFSITFNAQAGANVPATSTPYLNSARVNYAQGSNQFNSAVNDTAAVTIPTNLSISKTIDCVYNAALTACNAYSGSGIIPVGAKLRYRMTYQNTGTTNQSNVFLCDQLPTQVAGIAAVTTPSLSPTPSGAFTDNPNIGSRTSPANAACGFTAGTTFSYSVGTLNAGASGVVFFDVQTNATAGAFVTNTGKIVSTQAPLGETSSVAATAINVPVLSIVKTATTSGTAPGGVVGYTISVVNTGNAAATSVKVYDFLPTSGASANPATRFNFNTGSTLVAGAFTAVTPVTATPPTISPFSSNANQQQVLWDFTGQSLAAGASFTVTFSATAGASMPQGSYNNIPYVSYDGAAGGGSATGAAVPINVFAASVSGKVYADFNHNAVGDGSEAGTNQPVCAKLIQSGVVTHVANVDPVTGAYNIPGIAPGNYTLIIDSNNCTVGSTDITPTLPNGWIGTEFANQTRSITVTSLDVTDQNFGLYNGSKLTGTVFKDTGAPSGVANDGILNGGEVGISGVSVQARNPACASNVCDGTVSDAAGNYTLWIPASAVGTVSIVEANLGSYISTGAQVGTTAGSYARTIDTVSFTQTAGTFYTGVNFADVPDNSFNTDGVQSGSPGSVLFYAHSFTADSAGSVTFSTTNLATPSLVWSNAIYRDTNCNGVLDTGEGTATYSGSSLSAGQVICIIVKEFIPANAPLGAKDQITVTASFNYVGASPALSAIYTHTDTTTVGAAGSTGLTLLKAVNKASAFPGELLIYTITYTNNSIGPLTNVVINDSTPAFTVYVGASAGCPLLVTRTACTVTTEPANGGVGSIGWNITGTVGVGISGTVQYQVKVQD